ncbi:MAG: membrane protein insertase YidC, partial [Psychrosphaera sp.]|nr:membrane protein insertase YidC [Psychrosphaera sp.]
MESQRSFLFIALVLVSFFLFQEWQEDYHPQQDVPQQVASSGDTPSSEVPASDSNNADVPASARDTIRPQLAQADRLIKVHTNVLDLVIDTKGGDILGADLKNYPIEQGEPALIALLSKNHQAQSGLIGKDGPDGNRKGRPNYLAPKLEYTNNGDADIVIPLTWSNGGLTVTKTLTIKANEYDIDVSYTIKNNSSEIKTVQPYAQLKKLILAPETSMMMNAYNAATYSTKEERYEKYDMDEMEDRNLSKNTVGGWVAMQQHYFVAAWVPNQQQQNNIFTKVASNGSGIIDYKGPLFEIQPGQTETISTTLYAGPKNQEKMAELAEYLDLTVDYGPLWFISKLLFWLLNILHGLIPNWGVAIILITVVVKFILYPLTKKQTISMAKMRKLQPKLAQLKERFGDDKQKMGPAMMELYKKEQVNPMGGCLPLLLQMPIFLS